MKKIKPILALLRNVKSRTFQPGEVLITEGSSNKELFFVRKGLVRCFYINSNADEITFQLFPESNVVLNFHTLLFDEPSKFVYMAYEPTKAYSIDYDFLMKLTVENAKFLELNRSFIGKRAIKQAFMRIESLVFLTPEERYIKYLQDYPNIVNRAPDKYIANVLGITPVSLSRIRNRLANRKDKRYRY
jgi:CRP-like cAMP-binding protein